jgi:ribose transport system substrate-binding protein
MRLICRSRWYRVTVCAIAACLLAGAWGGPTAKSQGVKSSTVLVGFANITGGNPTLTGMEQVITNQAKRRGWKTLILNNAIDGPTALKNAEEMITKHVTYAIEFQAISTLMPTLMAKFNAAHIPVIAFDIPAPGAYFLGAPNHKSGTQAGTQLGNYAKKNWNCKPDLVMLLDAPIASKVVSDLRVGGVEQALLKVCPNLDQSVVVRRDGGGTTNTALPVARDILTAHPTAQKILISGMNDVSVVGGLNAAEQLQRTSDIFAWGQDGGVLTSGNADPLLAGSVLYFLEGYGIYAFRLLDKIHAGHPPPIGDQPNSKHATLVGSCAVSKAQAAKIPAVAQRITKLIKQKGNAPAPQLFCPKTKK